MFVDVLGIWQAIVIIFHGWFGCAFGFPLPQLEVARAITDSETGATLFESVVQTLHETQLYLQDVLAAMQSFVTFGVLLYWFRLEGMNSTFTSRFISQDLNIIIVIGIQFAVYVLTWLMTYQILKKRLTTLLTPKQVQQWCVTNKRLGLYCLLDEYLKVQLKLTPKTASFVSVKKLYERDHPHLFVKSPDCDAANITDFLMQYSKFLPSLLKRVFWGFLFTTLLVYASIFETHIGCPTRYFAQQIVYPVLASNSTLCSTA